MAVDASDNIIIAGEYRSDSLILNTQTLEILRYTGTRSIGGNFSRVFLAKYKGSDGSSIWAQGFTAGSTFSGDSLTTTGYIANYTGDGVHRWSKAMVFSSSSGTNTTTSDVLALDSFGNPIVGDQMNTNVSNTFNLDGENLQGDMYLVKFSSANGDHQWSNSSDSVNTEVLDPKGAVLDNSSVAIIGSFQQTVNLGGVPLVSNSNSSDVFFFRFFQ